MFPKMLNNSIQCFFFGLFNGFIGGLFELKTMLIPQVINISQVFFAYLVQLNVEQKVLQ